MPAGPHKKNPGKINVPIMCGGVNVQPGDLIAGDCDGVCVVPHARIAETLEKAEEKLIYEKKRKEAIQAYIDAKASGLPLPQLAPQWVLDMLNK
jgi:regulator of RNase E activity RraA